MFCFRLGAGWSVHTSKYQAYNRGDKQLSAEEQEQIEQVIRRSDLMENLEMERIGCVIYHAYQNLTITKHYDFLYQNNILSF